MKIAIVYDWIDKWGGVERVLLDLHQMYPEAVFYTSYYDPKKASWAKDLKIRTSFLQNFPNFIKKSRILSFIFYPFVFESFDFGEFDLVISVTSSFAKSIITRPGTKHICYLLTPTRYLWSHEKEYFGYGLVSYLVRGYLGKIKRWDLVAAQRPDKIISISKTVKERCLKYYQRESEVVYPGFDAEYWNKIKSEIRSTKSLPAGRQVETNFKFQISNFKFFLVVSRLEPYKRVDLVIRSFDLACRQAGLSKNNLIIVGTGSQKAKLKKIAGNNILFMDNISDLELGELYSKAQALIMMQEEDFGLVSFEAQFFGCPVIAFKKGGVVETVEENKTGIFFESQSKESLLRAIERFEQIKYNLKTGMEKSGAKKVGGFDRKIFEKRLANLILSY